MNSSPLQHNDNTIYCLTKNDTKYHPASGLDHVFRRVGSDIKPRFFDFYTGDYIETNEDYAKFLKTHRYNIENKLHPTTDHLPMHVVHNNLNFLYFSLENSEKRSQQAEGGKWNLVNRLPTIAALLRNMIQKTGGNCFIFFSESKRHVIDKDGNVLASWEDIVKYLEDHCGIIYQGVSANNHRRMSFGVSLFCTPSYQEHIQDVIIENILPGISWGSGALGLFLSDSSIVWGIHFPLDFVNRGKDNEGHTAMKNLCAFFDRYPQSVFAFGDFNTIKFAPNGDIDAAIRSAITEGLEFDNPSTIITFYAAHYDTFPVKAGEEYVLL